MKPQSVIVGETQIRILPTVKGLVSESEIVEDEINSFKPDLVALSIGPEEVKGTREWDGEPYDMSGWDEVYGLSLRKLLGDNSVRLPPPSFSTAIKISDSKNIEVVGIDMDEEEDVKIGTSAIQVIYIVRIGHYALKFAKHYLPIISVRIKDHVPGSPVILLGFCFLGLLLGFIMIMVMMAMIMTQDIGTAYVDDKTNDRNKHCFLELDISRIEYLVEGFPANVQGNQAQYYGGCKASQSHDAILLCCPRFGFRCAVARTSKFPSPSISTA